MNSVTAILFHYFIYTSVFESFIIRIFCLQTRITFYILRTYFLHDKLQH